MLSLIKKKIHAHLPIDFGWSTRSTVLISGEGRSGTTWLSELINHQGDYRDIFEPFWANKVPEARPFRPMMYVRPENKDLDKIKAAKKLLTGRLPKNPWTDQFEHSRNFYSRRIVKDIRTNLMLGWIRGQFPEMPIILIMRHPCAVASSWLKLNWLHNSGKQRSPQQMFEDTFLSQPELIEDYLSELLPEIQSRCRSDFDFLIILWCVHNFVALKQMGNQSVHVTFYEHLVDDPVNEMRRVFHYLGRPIDNDLLKKKISSPSTMSNNNSAIVQGGDPVSSWKKKVSADEIKRAKDMLKLFELDKIYTADDRPLIKSFTQTQV